MARATSATNAASLQRAKKNLQKFLRTLDTVPDEEIKKEIPKIKVAAVAQTPYETGKLEASVYVRQSKSKKRVGILAGASARDPKTGYNYAGVQHEDASFNHPIKGKAYYIRDPFVAGVRRLKARIRRQINKAKPKGV